IALLREYVRLDFEPFPLEWNLSQLERASTSAAEEDQHALALARARLATRSGDFERAKAELQSTRERRPDDPMVWKAWLDWAVPAGRLESAREALDHVPARQLDPARILELRAWLARQRGDASAERRSLEQLIEHEPGRTAGLTRLAELLQ